jgi:membrane-bound serine protease (ClpP class)
LLAFFAFQVLPVSSVGILLILFGLVLLILEVKITSYGLLSIGGILSLFFGSILLMDSPLPELQVGLRMIVPVTLTLSGIMIFLVRLAVKAQRTQPITGDVGMLGTLGQALTPIEPGGTGRIRTRGEIWTATATEPINAGDMVRVTGVNGLTLTVRRDHTAPKPAPVEPSHS